MVDLIQRLVLFSEIVEQGSISAAALNRGMTRSAVSKQLARLEQETGVRLLNRNTRSMSLTGPGQMLYDQALRVRESHRETAALIAGLGQQVRGELRLASSFHFGRFYLTEVLRGFAERYPRVTLNLQLSDRISDIVSDNIDLAIRIGGLQDSRLIARQFCNNPVVMVAAAEYLERYGMPGRMEQLTQLPCVVYAGGGVAIDHWAYRLHGETKRVQVQTAFKTNDGQLLLDACESGFGIGLLPTYVAAQGIRNGRLQVVLPEVKLEDYESIYLVYASRLYMSPALSEFIDHLWRWVQQHPIPGIKTLLAGG